jgi:hypothetical protein
MRIESGVGDLVQRTRDGQAQVGYSVAGPSRGRVTLCAVCTIHKQTSSTSFLVLPQNQDQRFLPVWPQNRWQRFLWFGLKITCLVSQFGELTHKITTTDSWFGPQNQVGYGLSVVLQNQREDEDGVGALIEF